MTDTEYFDEDWVLPTVEAIEIYLRERDASIKQMSNHFGAPMEDLGKKVLWMRSNKKIERYMADGIQIFFTESPKKVS